MYDLEFYENETRGFYISLEDLPGPIVQTEAECVQELKKEFVYDDKYKRFNERFTSLEDGHATERVINRCFK
jgi:CDP-glycerol glycerophosphotransferase